MPSTRKEMSRQFERHELVKREMDWTRATDQAKAPLQGTTTCYRQLGSQ
ncbi:uncharacterized protein HMPREF1541_06363 [Cyphellophora europaea CBS 101466]|uniref:Uncharacterized protein n=1 Tax=Cyphellophora europaea (strain CBS 101466) TaxID=1220924 RepID=W2RRH9_CYPE1|nr:uncharacterized protein HMPREF1541_06363 [Cyphellophora europaea CBS 101466]ETN38328.1 hypothetical protein HMPREF1541_06363 [Cyphellophora europaea CBS 101466]